MRMMRMMMMMTMMMTTMVMKRVRENSVLSFSVSSMCVIYENSRCSEATE